MTDTFFLISNYNTDPSYLLKYCKNYIIYDQSDPSIFDIQKTNLDYVKYENTGHNITSYFQYFVDNYDDLPSHIALLKGNVIGRHISEDYFKKIYKNKFFTYIFSCESVLPIGKSHHVLTDNVYVELNNSWYTRYHPVKFFNSYNSILKFIYKNPLISKYCTFSPGGCYIISKENIHNNSKEFYENLIKIINYNKAPESPSEAHIIERMLPVIFNSCIEKNRYMDSLNEFDKEISKLIEPKFKFSLVQYVKSIFR